MFEDLTPAELAEIMSTVQRAMRALDVIMNPQGYNFGANLGTGQRGGDRRSHPFSPRPPVERRHEFHACPRGHEGDLRGYA